MPRRDTRYVVCTPALLVALSGVLLYLARTDDGQHYLTENLDEAVLCLDPEEAGQLLESSCVEEPRRVMRSWRVYDVDVITEETVKVTRRLADERYPPQIRLPAV